LPDFQRYCVFAVRRVAVAGLRIIDENKMNAAEKYSANSSAKTMDVILSSSRSMAYKIFLNFFISLTVLETPI